MLRFWYTFNKCLDNIKCIFFYHKGTKAQRFSWAFLCAFVPLWFVEHYVQIILSHHYLFDNYEQTTAE